MRRALCVYATLVVVVCGACGGGQQVAQKGGSPAGGPQGSPGDAGAAPPPVASTTTTAPATTPPAPGTTIAAGGWDNGPSDSPQAIAQKYGGATVTPQARAEALAEIGSLVMGHAGDPTAQREATLVAALKARPEIEDAGANAGLNVWARFKDGKQMVIPTYAHFVPRDAHAEAEPARRSWSRAKTVPTPKRVQVFDAMSYDPSVIGELPGWMRDNAYEPYSAGGTTATVEGLTSSVHGDGVFYINAHGGMGYERTSSIFGSHDTLYSIMTGTPVRDDKGQPIRGKVGGGIYDMDAGAAAYESDLSDGSLVYFYSSVRRTDGTKCAQADGSQGTWCPEWRYAFTHRFVNKHFDFGKDSFVFLNACSSVSAMSADMDAALMAKNAGLVVGWSNVIEGDTAIRAAEVTIDRMLGENKMHVVPPDTPKQRPWPFLEVYQELVAKGWDHYTGDGLDAHLATMPPGGDALLVPSLAYLDVDENTKKIVLHGDFGDDPGDGKVTISQTSDANDGGAALSGCSWQSDTIKCDIGDDQAGYVRAVAHGHQGNAVALSRFHTVMNFRLDAKSSKGSNLLLTSALDGWLRFDAQQYRRHPNEAPKARDAFRVNAATKSTCKANASGFGVDDHGGRHPFTGSQTATVMGPYPGTTATPGETGGPAMPAPLGAPGGIALPPGVNLPPGAAAALGAMPDPLLLTQAQEGKCAFGGRIDMTQQPTPTAQFAWSEHYAPFLALAGYTDPSPVMYNVELFMKKTQDPAQVMKQMVLNLKLVSAPQGGTVTILGDELDQDANDSDSTLHMSLKWSDTNGEFPPDPQGQR